MDFSKAYFDKRNSFMAPQIDATGSNTPASHSPPAKGHIDDQHDHLQHEEHLPLHDGHVHDNHHNDPMHVLSMLNPPDLYEACVKAGVKKAGYGIFKEFVLGILAGCHIGFGATLVYMVGVDCPELKQSNPGLYRMVCGIFGFPFGLYMVVATGSDLFTGNCAYLLAAVLEKKATIKDMLRVWFLSWFSNFVGSLLLSAIMVQAGIFTNDTAIISFATAKASHPFLESFLRGVICNWLVCLAVYMAAGSTTATGKFITILLPISMFVALTTDHCVANMFFLPTAMQLGADFGYHGLFVKNLLPVTLGNILGGAIPVALAYHLAFSHSKHYIDSATARLGGIDIHAWNHVKPLIASSSKRRSSSLTSAH